MATPPSRLWKELPADTRLAAAAAFWRDDEALAQQAEAIVVLARRLNFRPKSVQGLPVERRARFLAQATDVSDALAGRALIAYHFEASRPLMAAFLDALGIAHEDGLITTEEVPPPDEARLADAIATVRGSFSSDAVELYLRTLVALDGDTWRHLDSLVPSAGGTPVVHRGT